MSVASEKFPSSRSLPDEAPAVVAEREAFLAAVAAMPQSPIPPSGVDEDGRILPISEGERRARAEGFRRLVEEWKAQPDDDPPGAHEEALRSIDEERRRLGMRTLFDGYL